jgi:hypothetical protein
MVMLSISAVSKINRRNLFEYKAEGLVHLDIGNIQVQFLYHM